MNEKQSPSDSNDLRIGSGVDLLHRAFPMVGKGSPIDLGSREIGRSRSAGHLVLCDGTGAADVIAWTEAAPAEDDATAVGRGDFLRGGSGLDSLGEVEHAALFERTGLAGRRGAGSGPSEGFITIDELAVLVEASLILQRVQGERAFRKSTVEVASLGYATLQMLLDHTLDA